MNVPCQQINWMVRLFRPFGPEYRVYLNLPEESILLFERSKPPAGWDWPCRDGRVPPASNRRELIRSPECEHIR